MAKRKSLSPDIVIVESPTKARTLKKILGKDFEVLSSFGHIRDLHPQKFSVNIENGFQPQYVILDEKKKVLQELKKATRKARTVYLATDEDREGEAISWHLKEALGLPDQQTHRIAFHEITPRAIREAMKSPRDLNMHLVNAQQARRILDRIIGYQLSPVLWRKLQMNNLSAGRVQSVALRLTVEREAAIASFQPKYYFEVKAQFIPANADHSFEARIPQRIDFATARSQIALYPAARFVVSEKQTKRTRRNPPPPFVTSSLQQEAHHKLGISVDRIMRIAQQLYEEGFITYMRTDSTHLAPEAIQQVEQYVKAQFGDRYSHPRQYTTQNKLAQEAHEAIRPTDIRRTEVPGDPIVQRLYALIWKRTLASQMAAAEFDKTILTIEAPEVADLMPLQATGRILVFDGFLQVYQPVREESTEDTSQLPPVVKGEQLRWIGAVAREKITRPPYRYSEASLVRKLEELGIGRPSTYAPTIATLLRREYVRKQSIPPVRKQIRLLHAHPDGNITEETTDEPYGGEKNKLVPTDVGKAVVKFLQQYFPKIMDYDFTAQVEDQLDAIARGDKEWQRLLHTFYYDEFLPRWEAVKKANAIRIERLVGQHPKTGEPIYVKHGKYGPFIQIGEGGEGHDKPRFIALPKHTSIESVTFEDVLRMIELPRTVGQLEGAPIEVHVGPYGPYLKWKGKNYRMPRTYDPFSLQLAAAQQIIKDSGVSSGRTRIIHQWETEKGIVEIREGPYGPYIRASGKNYKLPEGEDIQSLTLQKVMALIATLQPSRRRGRRRKQSG